ncbi:hypothetical protein BLJAPNOD_06480 [Ensifer sp. M14]|uniref:Uncharacterized protein n=1 Tax=Sinorhizobium sp. M14 TaxID=430451 RepID=A0A142BP83_9HYPH|nr:hypothetical protein [Sinorhizobium sp. M14]AMP34891.1 hypothetical protein pSinB_024 [Sinorhizobium sp. M14]RDL46286.1 hypothetical protein BLJAPNOD_06480 [Ensifer sp. M14]
MTKVSAKYLTLRSDGAVSVTELSQEITAALTTLRDDPSLYFDLGEAHLLIPLDQLVNARTRERGIVNANRHMQIASKGNQGKRKPLTVRALGDELWARGGRQFDFDQRSSLKLAGGTVHTG